MTPNTRSEPADNVERRYVPKRLLFVWAPILILFFGVFLASYVLLLNEPPSDFPSGVAYTISEGSSGGKAAADLKAFGYIRSSHYLVFVLKSKFDDSFVHAGSYTFDRPLKTSEIAEAITSGVSLTPAAKATFPEGFKIADMKQYLPQRFTNVDIGGLIQYEGYLFPDTYFISDDDDIDTIVIKMRQTFEEKTKPFLSDIENSTLSLHEIITLASIVEREANTEESMRTVAGILLSRLEIGMPLQVDATFEYLLGKASHELTDEDLEIDSPYNTYMHQGLPPTPISNPGITAIQAVLHPIPSEFLYYLTAHDGLFHYAKTFEEHKENKARYLR